MVKRNGGYTLRICQNSGATNALGGSNRILSNNSYSMDFYNCDDALSYVRRNPNVFSLISNDIQSEKQTNLPYDDAKEISVYTDGNFNEFCGRFGFACVFVSEGKVVCQISGSSDDTDLASMRNVAGEIMAAEIAIKFAHIFGYKSVKVYYDYDGIGKWANGSWAAKKHGTRRYVDIIDEYNDLINIDFSKVKAHSGNYYNDLADKLASAANH